MVALVSSAVQAQPACEGDCNIVNGNVVEVGLNGASGELAIQNGDVVSAPDGAALGLGGGQAIVNVTGTGSRLEVGPTDGGNPRYVGWLLVGETGGAGSLNISDGASVVLNDESIGLSRVRIGSAGIGQINVTGGGSMLIQSIGATDIRIARIFDTVTSDGTGELNVSGPGSSVVLEGGDSAFLQVGRSTGAGSSTAALNITNGSSVLLNPSAGFTFVDVAGAEKAQGSVLIDGAGSALIVSGPSSAVMLVGIDYDLDAPTHQQGTLVVRNSGVLEITSPQRDFFANPLAIGSGSGSGFVTVETGGLIRVDGLVAIASDDTFGESSQQLGSLLVNGTGAVEAESIVIGNNLFANRSAFLRGDGALSVTDSVTLNATGLLSPGASDGAIGTLFIDGNFVSQPGGILEIDALEDGTADSLSITGTATLNGGQVSALSPDGDWSIARQYTILTADGGVVGTFDGVTSNLEYLLPSLSYTPNTVVLSLTRVGAAVQEDVLRESNAQQLSVTTRVVSTVIQNQISGTLGAAFSRGTGAAAVYTPGSISTGLNAGDDPSSGNAWMNFTPSRYELDAVLPGSSQAQAIDGTSWNFMLGLDQLVHERVVVGAFAGAEGADIDMDRIRGKQENEGFMLGAYTGVSLNKHFYIGLNGSYAWLENSLEEQAFGTPTPVEGEYDSERYSVGADLNAVKVINSFDLRAQIGYNYSKERYDNYRTSVGDTARPEDQKLGRARVAFETSYLGETFRPYTSVAYEHDVETTVDNDEDGWVLYAGLRSYGFVEGLSVEAFVSGMVDRGDQGHNMLGLNLHYAW